MQTSALLMAKYAAEANIGNNKQSSNNVAKRQQFSTTPAVRVNYKAVFYPENLKQNSTNVPVHRHQRDSWPTSPRQPAL